MPQIITTAAGEKLAVLPLADYEALLAAADDTADARAAEAARADLASGADELVPLDFARRLVDGAHPVRALRRLRGVTSTGLAVSAGITQGYLSQIETGKRTPTADVRRRLADALGVDPADLD